MRKPLTVNIEKYQSFDGPYWVVTDSNTMVALGAAEKSIEDATRWALDAGYNIGEVEDDEGTV